MIGQDTNSGADLEAFEIGFVIDLNLTMLL